MLQRKFRLPSSVQFKTAQTLVTPFFLVKIAKNDLEISRFGFIVSKKVDKRAVVRNRVKRQIRSEVESELHLLRPGYDVLFIIKPAAVGKDTVVLTQEVKQVFLKKGLVVKENTV